MWYLNKVTFGMDIEETWKKIRGYPYKVSNLGRIKRSGSSRGTRVGKILKPSLSNQGYLKIVLSKNMKIKTFSIHRLVAEAFIGPCPKDRQANHIDGIKKNNFDWNLEYVTGSENIKHAYESGLKKTTRGMKYNCGINHPKSRLTEKDVRKIRRLYKTGNYIQNEIAEMFNVSRRNISNVITRRLWKHVS